MRRITVSVASIIHSVKTPMVRRSRFGGSTKFEVIPEGGTKAGPLSSRSLNLSRSVAIVTVLSRNKVLGSELKKERRDLTQVDRGSRFEEENEISPQSTVQQEKQTSTPHFQTREDA